MPHMRLMKIAGAMGAVNKAEYWESVRLIVLLISFAMGCIWYWQNMLMKPTMHRAANIRYLYLLLFMYQPFCSGEEGSPAASPPAD